MPHLIILTSKPIFQKLVCQRAHEIGIAIICVNLVGGQDELVFDGASFVTNNKGELTNQFDEFTETLGLIEFQGGSACEGNNS